ncbi:hypothetical protein SS50377_27430 [Spironucleus salmonicida]|uniref:Uncharacterized protein n=1 Tax=Spironucleus salmonicida TaxID=348837 RepID=V6LFG3_9EUKA|nr:hypothetical protein SS50377_27430 [Spironucleus salmonicida]|eukprot:EST43280.1 hypothetical protein SS50377_16944 [Spironucleus salmonicida]
MSQQIYTPQIQKIPLPFALPQIPKHFYNETPTIPLFSMKYAQQLVFSSGFDATWRIQLRDIPADPDNIPTDIHILATQFYYSELQKHSTIDQSLANSIVEDLEDDAHYIKLHSVMEVVERLHDHNKVRTEVNAYDIIDRYGDEIALENQYYKTQTPYQTYLQPQIQTIQQFHMHSRYTNLDYNYQLFSDRINCCIYPNYDKNKLQPSDFAYRDKIFEFGADEFNGEIAFRSKSAHEMWVDVLNNAQLKCQVQDAYISIIEDYNVDLQQVILQSSNIQQTEPNFLDQLIDSVLKEATYLLDSSILVFNVEHQYIFGPELIFDSSVQALIQYKQSNNLFYTFNSAQKRSFLAPLVAERILTYTRIGSFSNYISNLNSQSSKAFNNLTEQFLKSFKRQHCKILKNTFLNVHNAQNFITNEIQTEKSASKNILIFRPMCGCYMCNISAIYDAQFYDYQIKTFPNVPIQGLKLNYPQIIQEIFSENSKNIEKQFPYLKVIMQQCKKLGLVFELVQDNNIHNNEKSSKRVLEFTDEEFHECITKYINILPNFISYDQPHYKIQECTEFPSVKFDQNFKKDICLCFSQNPHLLQFLDHDAVEEISEVSDEKIFDYNLDFRLQPLNQSCIIGRNFMIEGGINIDYETQGIGNWSFLQNYISVYGTDSIHEADFLEETPLDIHYDEKFKVNQGKILGELGPSELEKKISDVFYKRQCYAKQ